LTNGDYCRNLPLPSDISRGDVYETERLPPFLLQHLPRRQIIGEAVSSATFSLEQKIAGTLGRFWTMVLADLLQA
jgi:hypothetical protein